MLSEQVDPHILDKIDALKEPIENAQGEAAKKNAYYTDRAGIKKRIDNNYSKLRELFDRGPTNRELLYKYK